MVRIITAGAWLALLAFTVLFLWSWSTSGIAFDLVRLDLDAPAKLQKIRYFFADCGHFAPVVYFAMVTIPSTRQLTPNGLAKDVTISQFQSCVVDLRLLTTNRWASRARLEITAPTRH